MFVPFSCIYSFDYPKGKAPKNSSLKVYNTYIKYKSFKERRYFMGKIATRAFCNTLKAGAFSSELTRCPTRSEIETAGLTITGTYTTNQLVMEGDIIGPVTVVVVGASGNIIKTQV